MNTDFSLFFICVNLWYLCPLSLFFRTQVVFFIRVLFSNPTKITLTLVVVDFALDLRLGAKVEQ